MRVSVEVKWRLKIIIVKRCSSSLTKNKATLTLPPQHPPTPPNTPHTYTSPSMGGTWKKFLFADLWVRALWFPIKPPLVFRSLQVEKKEWWRWRKRDVPPSPPPCPSNPQLYLYLTRRRELNIVLRDIEKKAARGLDK